MKTRISILVLCLFIGTSIFSQVKLRPGIRLGANISNISGLDEASSKAGFYIAAFGNVHFSKLYELQLELGYSNQGANVINDIVDEYYDEQNDIYAKEIIGQEEVRSDIDYISIGIMNKFFIASSGLHFIVGPSVDITYNNDAYFGALFPSVDVALTGGIGYQFPFGLAIEARYKQGLLDVDNDLFTSSDSNFSFNNNTYLNTVFQLGLSYKFDF